VLQDTLVKIWAGSAGFNGRSSVSTWACRIAINAGVSALRRWRPSSELDEIPSAGPEAGLELREDARAVRAAVLELPLKLRTVIVLREFEDLPYKAIAEIVDVPIGTVMSRLHDARGRLRRRLEPLLRRSE
jgi:RNA polymerase sigma-70 factor (ECF subfamily)